MKRKMKKLFIVSACVFILPAVMPSPVQAETVVCSENEYAYIFQNEGFREGWSINTGVFTVNGEAAYCIEPSETIAIGENIYETASWETWEGYPQELKDRITEYTCFGYGWGNRTGMEYWCAAQILIWQAINPVFKDVRVYRDPSYDGSGFMSPDTVEITDSINLLKQEIQNTADRYNTQPQIVITDESGNILHNGDTAECGETLRIKDTAGVLSDYESDAFNASYEEKDDSILLTAENAGRFGITFSYDLARGNLKGAPVLLKPAAGSAAQTLIIRGNADARKFTLSFTASDVPLRIFKSDAETGIKPHGSASVEGAQYLLRDLSADTEAGTLTIGQDGYSDILYGLNLSHTYSLKETKAPKGYLADETVYEFCPADLEAENGIRVYSVSDQILKKKLRVHKVISGRYASGISESEEGAEFTVLRKDTIEKYGSFEEAAVRWDEIPDDEKSVFTTDHSGIGESGLLVYGVYTVRQTKASSPDLQLCDDFIFAVDEETDENRTVEISNLANEYDIRIVKKDASDGRIISRSPACFQIFHSDGTQVKQKVGQTVYDTFMTSSVQKTTHAKNVWQDQSSKEGTLTLPGPLACGEYYLIETQAPYGYSCAEEPVPFTVSFSADTGNEKMIVLTVQDTAETGSLIIEKSLEQWQSDTSLLERENLSGIVFALYAKEDITDCADGSLIASKGSEYIRLTTGSDGHAAADHLPYGTYELKEIAVPDGMILSDESWQIEIGEQTPVHQIQAVNQTVHTLISKTDAAGENEIPGAHLTLYDENGNIIDEWISADTPHRIEGLKENGTYVLSEVLTPRDEDGNDAGYVRASSITFVPGELADHKVIMKNRTVSVSKQDMGGEELAGARMCVLDENRELIDSWISSDRPHRIRNLEAGRTYTLAEELPPEGWYRAKEMTFTVSEDGPDQELVMQDAMIRVRIRKLDERTGSDFAGVTLKLYEVRDEEGNEIEKRLVEEWITDGKAKEFDGVLKAGFTYLLEESAALPGVYKAADLQFRIESYDPGDEEPFTVVMLDAAAQISAAKTDQNGRYLPGALLRLEDTEGRIVHEWISSDHAEDLSPYTEGGMTYMLKEIQAPEGYACFEQIIFRVNGTMAKPQLIHAVDRPAKIRLEIIKKDADDGSLLADCEFGVFENGSGRLARDISGNPAKITTGTDGTARITLPALKEGYYVREIRAPAGYRLNPSRFEAEYDHSENPAVRIVTVEVTDEKTSVPTGTGMYRGNMLTVCGTAVLLAVLILCVLKRH